MLVRCKTQATASKGRGGVAVLYAANLMSILRLAGVLSVNMPGIAAQVPLATVIGMHAVWFCSKQEFFIKPASNLFRRTNGMESDDVTP